MQPDTATMTNARVVSLTFRAGYWRPRKVFVRKGNRGRRYVGGGWVR
jgi:hypothetical protein